jgi:glucan phosphoethanolaminetransferase (alkaline phosphatase superfamily)
MLLSVNDLLVGLFGNSSYVLVLITIELGYPGCKIYIAFEVVSFCLSSMSVMSLFALNIERYLSVLHPFYHRTKVTKSRLLKMVVAFWLFPLTLRSLRFIFGKIMKIIISASIVCIVFSTVYIYASIYIAFRRRPRLAEPRETEGRVTVTRVVEGRTNKKKELQNLKMTKSCAIVVGLVFVCNLPFAVTNSLPTRITPTMAAIWTITFSLSASSLNSLVFFWKNAILRKETKKLFQNLNK